MAQFDLENHRLSGDGGTLAVSEDDEITRKLSMLIEGAAARILSMARRVKLGKADFVFLPSCAGQALSSLDQ